jgi:hypothetical protein
MAKQLNIDDLMDAVALKLPDNFQRLITAALLREVLNDTLASYLNLVDGINYILYDGGTLYAIGDVVFYLDQLYSKASAAPAGTEPVDGLDWTAIAGPFSTDAIPGLTRFATDDEANDGTATNVAVTPLQLATYGGSEYTGEEGITVDNGLGTIAFTGGALTINGMDMLVTDNPYIVTTDTQDIRFISNNKVILDAGTDLQLKYNGSMPASGYMPHQGSTGVVFIRKPTEFSYRFSQGSTEFPDLLIGGVLIDTVSVTTGIATKQISINGGAYTNLIAGVSIPAGANITIKITYNIGYNGGTVAIKGGVQ